MKTADWYARNIYRLQAREIEEIPGSYYVARSIDQAFWAVINDDTIPKDAVSKWALIADEEISRKIDEYS